MFTWPLEHALLPELARPSPCAAAASVSRSTPPARRPTTGRSSNEGSRPSAWARTRPCRPPRAKRPRCRRPCNPCRRTPRGCAPPSPPARTEVLRPLPSRSSLPVSPNRSSLPFLPVLPFLTPKENPSKHNTNKLPPQKKFVKIKTKKPAVCRASFRYY